MEEGLEAPTAALPIEEGEVGYRSSAPLLFMIDVAPASRARL